MAAAAARSMAQNKKRLQQEKQNAMRLERQRNKAIEKLEMEISQAPGGEIKWDNLARQGFDPEIFQLMKEEWDDRRRAYEEDTVKRPLKDPEKFSGVAKSWILFSAKIEKITAPKEGQPDPFGQFIIGIIVVAGILVGLQTYDCTSAPQTHFGDTESGCNNLAENSLIITTDWIVLGIFTVECLLKMMSEGLEPWRYWTGPEWRWNNFDFVIVLFCMPGIGELIPGDGAVALLRLMRLMRVMKLVRQIPQLQMIIMGLVGGFRAISYIMMLMALIFYLYACAAIIFFGKNDPFHFGDLPKAFNTLFRMSTLEDWTDVMYINYYGCASPMFGSGLYTDHPRDVEMEYLGRMESYAHASESPTDDAPKYNETDRTFSPSYMLCQPGEEPSKVVVIIYMMTFIVISALVVLSLVIGAITMSMGGALAEMKAMEEKKLKTKKKKAAVRRLQEKRALEGGEKLPWRRRCCIWFVQCTGGGDDVEDGNKLKLVLGELMSGFSPANDAKRKMSVYSLEQNEKMKDDDLTGWRKAYMQLAEAMNRIERSPYFSNSITITIVIAGVLVGVQTDADTLESNKALFGVLDTIILIIFIVEIVVKMVAKEFRPWMYFFVKGVADSWNWFDFLIVLASLIPTGQGNLVVILRLLRLLRVLKVLKAFPGLLVIVSALISGLSSIGYIAVIMVLFFYVWGILGMMLFRYNDPWHFGTLHDTIVTLFRATTLEDWTDVMYTNMYGCDMWGYTREAYQTNSRSWCQYPKRQVVTAVVYFWFLIIIGSFVIMPLFIGVVVSGMEEAVEKQQKDKGMKKDLKRVLKKLEMKPDDPYVELYRVCFRLIDVDEGGTLGKDEIVLALDGAEIEIENERVNEIMKQSLGDHVPEGEFYPDEVEVDFAKFIALMHSLMQHSATTTKKTKPARPNRTVKNLEPPLDEEGKDPDGQVHLRDVSDESDGIPTKGPMTFNRPGYRGTKVVPAGVNRSSLSKESENPANLPGSPLRGPADQPAVQANPITDAMAPLESPQETKGADGNVTSAVV